MLDRTNKRRVYFSLLSKVESFAEKVAPIFKANNWTWGSKTSLTPFDIECTIRSLARDMITTLESSNDITKGCVSSGRLQVRMCYYSNTGWQGYIELVPECVII
jgi:hypothetical protein